MPALLERIQRNCLPKERIPDEIGIALDAQPCAALGLHRNVPDRQADQPVAGILGQLGPIDDGRLVGIERIEKHSAKQRLMRFTADSNLARWIASPAAGGQVRGFNERCVHPISASHDNWPKRHR